MIQDAFCTGAGRRAVSIRTALAAWSPDDVVTRVTPFKVARGSAATAATAGATGADALGCAAKAAAAAAAAAGCAIVVRLVIVKNTLASIATTATGGACCAASGFQFKTWDCLHIETAHLSGTAADMAAISAIATSVRPFRDDR